MVYQKANKDNKILIHDSKDYNKRMESLGLTGWLLLPDALRPFKIYCASPSITSQLVLFLWQTVEIDPLGQMRVVEALQIFVQKYDSVILSENHIHIADVQQFHCC